MAIISKRAHKDVVYMAKRRLINICSNNVPIYISFSGGKDSLVLAHLVIALVQEGKINPQLITVQFIDEEAIFPCIEETVLEWRKKFLMLGIRFEWYCLEVKHFNCFNQLENDESFICWDHQKEKVWVRRPPKIAITHHPLLKARKDTYQAFLHKVCIDGISLVGIRIAESFQRRQYIAHSTAAKSKMSSTQMMYPIYDWTNNDVWLYIKNNDIKIPNIYFYLWQSGISKNSLRVSQFFSIDTAKTLVKMNEYYPDLMQKVLRREPNAYLAALYWDSEMFGRKTATRKQLETEEDTKDYKQELSRLLSNINLYFDTEHKRTIAKRYKQLFIKAQHVVDKKFYKDMYEYLLGGDPKLRNLRALNQRIYTKYSIQVKKETGIL